MNPKDVPIPPRRFRLERLIALTALGIFLFNYPILGLFNQSGFLFGIPILYLYLFFIWLTFLGLLIWTLYSNPSGQQTVDSEFAKRLSSLEKEN